MTSFLLTEPTPCNCDHSYSILSGDIKPNELSAKYMQRFDEIICDFLREQGVPGAALHISLRGKPIYTQGYGINKAGQPVCSSSLFRIASISKVFTAIATIQLCHERNIPLSSSVFGDSGILPHFNKAVKWAQKQKITILDLLQHSAGWDRDIAGDHVFWYQQDKHSFLDPWNNEQLVKCVLNTELDFKPGTRHGYSNLGYMVLGMIIEQLSGLPYRSYVSDLFKKLDIDDIYIGNTGQDCPVGTEEVRYYNNKEPRVEKSVLTADSVVVPQYGSFPVETTGPYGGWVTSARTLVTLLDSLALIPGFPQILSPHLVQTMLMKPKFVKDATAWYGLGLDVEDSGASFGHTGAMEGTSSTVHHNENHLTWALLLNSWSKDMDLDGLIKYALSTINGVPLWQGPDTKCDAGEYFVMSADKKQCVQVMLPHHRVLHHVMMMKAMRYRIIHINALTLSDTVKFSIIWRKGILPEWCILINVELENFNDCVAKFKDEWRLIGLEAYRLNGTIYHLFLYEKRYAFNKLPQKIYALNDLEVHYSSSDVYYKMGYELLTQSILELDGTMLISCIFEKSVSSGPYRDWFSWVDLPIENYVPKLADAVSENFVLNYIKFYSTSDVPKISAAWVKSKTFRNVYQRHDVTKYGFLYELRENMKSNRPVCFISMYEHEGVIYFSTIFSESVRRAPKGKKKKARKPGSKQAEPLTVPSPTLPNECGDHLVHMETVGKVEQTDLGYTIVKVEPTTDDYEPVGSVSMASDTKVEPVTDYYEPADSDTLNADNSHGEIDYCTGMPDTDCKMRTENSTTHVQNAEHLTVAMPPLSVQLSAWEHSCQVHEEEEVNSELDETDHQCDSDNARIKYEHYSVEMNHDFIENEQCSEAMNHDFVENEQCSEAMNHDFVENEQSSEEMKNHVKIESYSVEINNSAETEHDFIGEMEHYTVELNHEVIESEHDEVVDEMEHYSVELNTDDETEHYVVELNNDISEYEHYSAESKNEVT